jgi:hypothetical protein
MGRGRAAVATTYGGDDGPVMSRPGTTACENDQGNASMTRRTSIRRVGQLISPLLTRTGRVGARACTPAGGCDARRVWLGVHTLMAAAQRGPRREGRRVHWCARVHSGRVEANCTPEDAWTDAWRAALWSSSARSGATINACLTNQNSKHLNCASKTPKTKVIE